MTLGDEPEHPLEVVSRPSRTRKRSQGPTPPRGGGPKWAYPEVYTGCIRAPEFPGVYTGCIQGANALLCVINMLRLKKKIMNHESWLCRATYIIGYYNR